jgi:hypothetical protein
MKCLFTIGENPTTVLNRVNNTEANGVEVVGVVVSPAHDSFTLYFKPADSTKKSVAGSKKKGVNRQALLAEDIRGPFFIACDHVAKALHTDSSSKITVVSAQEWDEEIFDSGPSDSVVKMRTGATHVHSGVEL